MVLSLLDNVADVLVHVALKDRIERAKQPHEATPVDCGNLYV